MNIFLHYKKLSDVKRPMKDKGDDALCDISHMISDARQRLAIILLTILSPTTWMISTMTSMTMTAATR